MRFRCEKDALAEALGTASRPASGSRGSHLAVLSGVRMELSGSELRLTGTDLELTMSAIIEVRGEEDGKAVVTAKLVNDIVRSLDAGAVDVVTTDTDMRITSGRSEFTLNLFPAEEWPQVAEPTGESVELDGASLADGLSQVVKAASKDDSRSPVLTGVLLSAEAGGLRLVSTDSYRLAVRDLPGTSVLEEGQSVLIPSRALAELQRLLAGSEQVTLTLSEHDASFHTGNARLTTRLIGGAFPDYKALIPQSQPNRLSVGRTELMEAVKRVRIMADDVESTPVKLDMSVDSLGLTAVNRKSGEAHETIDAKYEGEEMQVSFNPRFLYEGLEVTPGDEVTLETTNASKPALLRSVESPEFVYLLMPVRNP